MKKLCCFFVILSVIFALGVSAGAFFLWSISRILSLTLVVLGAGFWVAALFRFKSIEYLDDGERFTIRRGFFIHVETSLKKSGILYVTNVRFGSVTLFSVLHTASGSVIVFAEIAP